MVKKFQRKAQEARLGYFMVSPAVLCILLLAIYPLFSTFWYSMFSFRLQMINARKFVWFGNYVSLAGDIRFWAALKNTLVFTGVSVAGELLLGLMIALLINREYTGRGLVRAAVLVPWAIPTIVSAQMWKFIYHDQLGVLNDILYRLGIINNYKSWLGTAENAMGAAIFTDVWKTTPFMALILLAGLQTIPIQLYEAAKVDGAGKLRQFWNITLPLLKSTMLVALVFRTMAAFRVFDLIYVLTGGGPANSTEVISLYAYKTIFRNLDFGMGSTMSVAIFLFVAVISIFYIQLLNTENVEG